MQELNIHNKNDTRESNQRPNEIIPISEIIRRDYKMAKEINTIFQKLNTREVYETLAPFGVSRFEPGMGDRLAGILTNLYGKNIFFAMMIILIIGLLPAFISIGEGTFINNNSIAMTAMQDPGYWDQYALGLPILVFTISMYFGRFPKYLLELVFIGVFPISSKQWNEFVKKTANRIYSLKIVTIFPYLVGIGCMIGLSLHYLYCEPKWYRVCFDRSTSIAGWFVVIDIFLQYYLVAFGVTRIIATFFVLKEFFKFPANIQPLHPDASGGLSPLGKLSTSLNIGAFGYGIICVIGIVANYYVYGDAIVSPENIAIMVAFVVGASIVFFMPLLAAHSRMKEAKYDTIQTINNRFECLNAEIIHSLEETCDVDKRQLEKLESLKKIHEIALKMPVFPFNIKTVSSFLGSIFLPVITYIITTGIGQILFPPASTPYP
jgi:hypothetical protein